MQAVPITDIVKNSISSTDTVTDPIIGTSLIMFGKKNHVKRAFKSDWYKKWRGYITMKHQMQCFAFL